MMFIAIFYVFYYKIVVQTLNQVILTLNQVTLNQVTLNQVTLNQVNLILNQANLTLMTVKNELYE